MTVQIVDQEIIGKVINGSDYGKKSRLLARSPEHILVWVPGHMGYMRVSGNTYGQAEMIAFKRKSDRESITICTGERLSGAVFSTHATEIDKIFGTGSYALLAKNKTVVFDDCKPWSVYGNEVPIGPHNFGYAAVKEKNAIRDRLLADGVTNEIELHCAVEEAYVEAHKNDLTLRERQDIRKAKNAKENANAPKAASITFTEEEIVFLKDHFDMANDPTAQGILAKLRDYNGYQTGLSS